MRKADSERSLFSLSKTAKETTPYPSAFGGNKGENVYVFRKKFLEAIEANQVMEINKLDVLKQHIKGKAKDLIGDL